MRRRFCGFLTVMLLILTVGTAYGAEAPGTLRWYYPTGAPIYSSPAIGADGTIYVGSQDGSLYAIEPDGTLKWAYDFGGIIDTSPAIGADGTIYVTPDGILSAVNPNGTLKWSYDTDGLIDSSPAIGADGTIYVASWLRNYFGPWYLKLWAINPDGTLKWTESSYLVGGAIYSSPAIGADGTIYVGSSGGGLYAVNPDGTLKWNYGLSSSIYSSPAIGADGTIYFGSDDGNLYAINPDGTLGWTYNTGAFIYSSPAIGADGTIYFGSDDGNLYAINPDGTLGWTYNTDRVVRSSPVVAADGTIYVGSWDSRLYAVNSLSSGLANTPWPMFRHDPTRVGRFPVLTVTRSGTGTGTVTSVPSGIDCGAVCNKSYTTSTSVTLTAQVDSGSVFSGWSGDCSGTGPCVVTLGADRSVGATFSKGVQGVPKISVSPSTINIGTVKEGSSVSKTLKVKNTGSGTLLLGDLVISGANGWEFSASTIYVGLAKNQTCTVTVRLAATSFGLKTATLAIPSNDDRHPTTTVELRGTCAPPKISISPVTVNFGTLSVGATSRVRKVTISNRGTSDLIIAPISPIENASFTVTDNTCSTLAKGRSCTVSMIFAPSAIGSTTGSLVISSNDPSRETVAVKLSGKGD